METARDALVHWLKSTPNRTFVLYPVCVIVVALALHGRLAVMPWGVLLLLWGYFQYRFVGTYRTASGGGGPGFQKPPERIVDEGPYRFTRNPMYLGHLIFMLGLAITFQSWLALGILIVNAYWFHQRVLEDERALETRFGADYVAYKAEVKRWIPGVL